MVDEGPASTLGGKVAIVTGAARGMGRAEALVLARAGAAVVVNDLPGDSEEPAQAVVDEIVAAGGKAILAACSISSFAGGETVVSRAVEEFGRVDIVVNTAGIYRMGPIPALSEADWDAVVDVNLKGTFGTIRAALPRFKEQGGGVIVNKSSDAGLGDFYNAVYAATKEGVVGITRAVAREWGRYGVRCNAIRPRAFDTGMANSDSWGRQYAFNQEFGRPACGTHDYNPRTGLSVEVAEVVAWLCSDEAAHVSGRVIQAGCGEVGLWSETEVARSSYQPDGLAYEDVAAAGAWIFDGLENPYSSLPDEAFAILDARLKDQRKKE